MSAKTVVCATLLSVVMAFDCLAVQGDIRCEVKKKNTAAYAIRNGVCTKRGEVRKGTRHYSPRNLKECRGEVAAARDLGKQMTVRLLRDDRGVVKGYAELKNLTCI